MMGKPNCSWPSNFRINGNLRPRLNWIWVSCFRPACVLCLIRGNMCAKYPRMGQTRIFTGSRIRKQRELLPVVLSKPKARRSLACTPVITPLTSHNPMRKIYELTAEDSMEKQSLKPVWKETTQAISISFARLVSLWEAAAGRPARAQPAGPVVSFFFSFRGLNIGGCLRALKENDKLGKNKHGSGPWF